MTRKDGLLALLVVVVWGLNFVVIKLGLHNMPPLMLAGLRFMLVAFPALLFVARPAIPLRLLLGYGLTISFGQFAFLFCAIGRVCRPGWPPLCCRRKPSSPSSLAPSSLANVCRASSWRGSPGDLWRAGAGGGQPWRGACAAGGLYADPRGGAQLGLRQYFQQENHVPASRPPIMSLVVWSALIPVLPFMLASLLIDGPQTMLASLQHIDLLTILSLLYLAFIATIVGYGIWGSLLGRYENGGWRRCRCWCRWWEWPALRCCSGRR